VKEAASFIVTIAKVQVLLSVSLAVVITFPHALFILHF
jgi:hypothetical protein